MSLEAAAWWIVAIIAAASAWLFGRIAVDNYRRARRPHRLGGCAWCRREASSLLERGKLDGAALVELVHYPPGTYEIVGPVCVTGAPVGPDGVCLEHGETACVIGLDGPGPGPIVRRRRHRRDSPE